MNYIRYQITLLLLFTACEAFAVKEVELLRSYMTSGWKETTDQVFKRSDKSEFTHEDEIIYFANFTWVKVEKSGGRHKAIFKWYSNGKLISAPKWKGKFKFSPWEVRSWLWGATLGYGNHKIEMYLDGNLVDTKEFRVIKNKHNNQLNATPKGGAH